MSYSVHAPVCTINITLTAIALFAATCRFLLTRLKRFLGVYQNRLSLLGRYAFRFDNATAILT